VTERVVAGVKVPVASWPGKESGRFVGLCAKVALALPWMLDRFPHALWFVKADTDTFVVPRALLELLDEYDPYEPYYVGHRSQHEISYNSGALYTISRPALEMIAPALLAANFSSYQGYCYEDEMIGKYLLAEGIEPTDAPGIWPATLEERARAFPQLRQTPVVAAHQYKNADAARTAMRLVYDSMGYGNPIC
jgi:hypothetical protein